MFYQEEVHEENTVKEEPPGEEQSAVIEVECKVEIKEENMDTEDPLSGSSFQGEYQSHTYISSSFRSRVSQGITIKYAYTYQFFYL